MVINGIMFNADLDDVITELKEQLKINGIQLLQVTKDTPDNLMVACPYHKGGQERRPSAGIKKSDGTFHCFACGETHSLQEMISHCFGHNDTLGAFGWNWLLKNFLTVSTEERKDIELDFNRSNGGRQIKSPGGRQFVSDDELDSYRYFHPYMYKRKLTDDIIERFDIGYDKKTQCITFPIRDIEGHTLYIARRSVNSKFFNYPVGVEKPVYGLYELTQIDMPQEIIICESMIDALTSWVYGKPAIALNGLGNDLQFSQLNRIPCRKFILATDMDAAGLNARDRIKKNIKNKIVVEYKWDLSIAKDINDMTQEYFLSLKEKF